MTEQRRNAKIALLDLTGMLNTFNDRIAKLNIPNDPQVRLAFENIRSKVDTFAKNESWWMSCLDTCEVDHMIRAVRDATAAVRESHENQLRGERQRDVLHNLTRALDRVIQAFESVGRYDPGMDKTTKSLGNREPTNGRLCFSADRMYVRLKASVDDVKAALESELCKIVVLYGEPGDGKSILAKHLALLYQDDSSTQFMDGVFFFTCGPQADIKGLLVQMWQELCYQCHKDLPNSNKDMHMLSMDVDVNAEYKVHIEQLLTNKKVLIILDDVPETSLVEKVVVKGKGIKYLVTTQKEGLLRCDDHLEIQITKPDLEDSRRILANHIRGFPGEIPPYLQVEMEKIVEKSRNNPLILANVAMKINTDRALEPDEWRSTSNSLINLHDGDIMNVSMRLAVDSFPSDSATRKLLIMAAICESQTVPEVVFEIFLNHLGLGEFSSSSEDLEKKNFIHIDSKVVEAGVPRRTWSIHNSRRNFILEHWRDDVVTLVSNLSKPSRSSDGHLVPSDGDLVCGLLVMYGWSNYSYQAASHLHIPISRGRSPKFDLVKPFVWLLHSDREKPWQQQSHEFAKRLS